MTGLAQVAPVTVTRANFVATLATQGLHRWHRWHRQNLHRPYTSVHDRSAHAAQPILLAISFFPELQKTPVPPVPVAPNRYGAELRASQVTSQVAQAAIPYMSSGRCRSGAKSDPDRPRREGASEVSEVLGVDTDRGLIRRFYFVIEKSVLAISNNVGCASRWPANTGMQGLVR